MSQDPEQLEALLAEYVDGELDAEGTRTVEAHLAANPSERTRVERMRSDRQAIRTLPRLTAPADLSEDMRGQLERDLLLNDKPMTTPRSRRFTPPVAAIAAMVMVGLGLGGVAYVLLGNRPTPYLDVALRDPASEAEPSAAAADASLATQAEARQPTGDATAAGRAITGPGDFTRTRAETAADGAATARLSAAGNAAEPVEAKEKSSILVPREPGTSGSAADSALAAAENASAAVATPLPKGEITLDLPAAPPAAPPAAAPVNAPVAADLELAEVTPPADVVAAFSGRSLDLARRSIVIPVDQRDALEALATVSRLARVGGSTLEVSERATQIALSPSADAVPPSNAVAGSLINNAIVPQATAAAAQPAEVAVVARGLSLYAAAAVQRELKQIDPTLQTMAYELAAEAVAPLVVVRDDATAGASTRPSNASGHYQAQFPAATLPATRAAPSAIRAGERLRVTLVDPDAFDLRTQHDVTVDPTGGIALPSLERVDAAGQSVDGLRRAIAEAYQSAKLIRRPVVKVESIQSGARSKEPADPSQLLDLYVVIRRPTTAPAATQPTSMPTTTDAP